MGIVLIFICTLIGYLCGSAVLGLIVGCVIVFVPLAIDEHDRMMRMRRIQRRNRYQGRRAMTAVAERITEADAYLQARTGCYAWRCVRYDAALSVMWSLGLHDDCTVFDVGSGWGEFGARLHTGNMVFDSQSRARYIPIDAANDGTDLETWIPPRRAEFFVALEVLEHLADPEALMSRMIGYTDRAVIVSTPNPETTDVIGMDATHKTPVTREMLMSKGFYVREMSFYGKPRDSLFAVWSPDGQ